MRKREKERETLHNAKVLSTVIEHANLQVAVMLTPGSDDK